MIHTRALTLTLATCATLALSAQTPQPPAAPPPPSQQPTEIEVVIGSAPGLPPKMAMPDFIPLTQDADTVAAARTIGQVLWNDLDFEREFYMIPRDTYRSIPQPASAEQVALDRWRELGADGVIIGTIAKGPAGFVVEVRLIQAAGGRVALAKRYSGSLTSLKDGGRIYAHTTADDVHQSQRGLRGVARTRLLFASDRDGTRMRGPTGARDISNIYRSDYDGANQIRLTYTPSLDITPVWSPDGSQMAYTSYRSGYPDIVVQSLTTGTQSQRPARGSADVQNYLPAWSPDGSKIAFMSSRDGNQEIYYVNRDGSNLRRVTNNPAIDGTPTWSPTGQQIAFVSDRTGSPQIYIVNIDGSGVRKITNESHCDRPTWSPAPFNEIAYTSQSGGGHDIKIYELATGVSRTITDGNGSNESPAFAPNGRHIAFASDRGGGTEQIYTIDRKGQNLRQVTKAGRNRYPNWSQ